MSLLQVDTIRNKTGTGAPALDQGVVVTGIATVGTIKIGAGIVTSTSGAITYYGDGQYLQNVGLAVTYIDNDVAIAGTITVNAINILGGGGIGGGAGAALSVSYINVATAATFGGVQIASGIVTAAPGSGISTVKYYGDGAGLTNVLPTYLAVYRRPATGRWSLGDNVVRIRVTNNALTYTGTFPVTARSGTVTVNYNSAGIPPLTL